MTEIKVNKIDYYSWKIGAIVLIFLFLGYMYFTQTHSKYQNPSGYVEAFVKTDKDLCIIRFPAECPVTTIVCKSDLNISEELS